MKMLRFIDILTTNFEKTYLETVLAITIIVVSCGYCHIQQYINCKCSPFPQGPLSRTMNSATCSERALFGCNIALMKFFNHFCKMN